MYAVIAHGGKQYSVQEGETLLVDHLNKEKGEAVDFDNVLIRGADIGTPLVEGAKVSATVLEPLVKGDKVYTLKYRRRKASSRSLRGHRQKYSRVRIEKIA